MRNFLIVMSCMFLSMPVSLGCRDRHVYVSSQEEFDKMGEIIVSAGERGVPSLIVHISKGTYYYSEKHIDLAGRDYDMSVSILGSDAVLIASGKEFPQGYSSDGSFTGRQSIISSTSMSPVDVWGRCEMPGSLIKVKDRNTKLCYVKSDGAKVDKAKCLDTFIIIPEWFMHGLYKVNYVRGGMVYFTADDLTAVSANYNVNYDFIYGQMYPRFRIADYSSIRDPFHRCDATVFLNCDKTRLKALQISGLHFMGNSDSWASLIRLDYTQTGKITVSNCVFEDINSTILNAYHTDNVIFKKNTVRNCWNTCVHSQNGSKNTEVADNYFENIGLYRNIFCVSCEGEDFHVSGNKMMDFCYGGIASGIWYKKAAEGLCTGVIENNELWYSREYIENKSCTTLMDSGAIYLSTQNDGVVVRNNNVHDYVGMKDNRGIFCDDGAYGFTIEGNTISNVPNSYSIDSRLCLDVEKEEGSVVRRVNVNNVMKRNKVDGKIRFELRPEKR